MKQMFRLVRGAVRWFFWHEKTPEQIKFTNF